MTVRASLALGTAILGASLAFAMTSHADPVPPAGPATIYRTVVETVQARSHGHSAAYWHLRNGQNIRALNLEHARSDHRGRRIRVLQREARRRWAPTLRSAVQLASAVTGVSAADMLSVAYCESTWQPFAVNGRYRGYWQLGWDPFGLSPFDPYAAALSTAFTVKHDGGWRQWSCKPR